MQPDTASALGGKQPTRILILADHKISRGAARSAAHRGSRRYRRQDWLGGDHGRDRLRPDGAVDVTPADPGGSLIAHRLRALPHASALMLTCGASQCRFGSQLDHYPFVAMAELCARADAVAAACALEQMNENRDVTDPGQDQDQAPPAAYNSGRSAHHQQQDSADMVSRFTAVGDSQSRWPTREGVLDELDLRISLPTACSHKQKGR